MWRARANQVKRFGRLCFSSKAQKRQLPEQSLHDADPDVYLVCDSNMVIDYAQACEDDPEARDLISGWRNYADKVAAHGET